MSEYEYEVAFDCGLVTIRTIVFVREDFLYPGQKLPELAERYAIDQVRDEIGYDLNIHSYGGVSISLTGMVGG